jgi:glycosyltransferase involved in cell wall biosynthesis
LQAAGYRVVGIAGDIAGCEVCRNTFDAVLEVPFSRRVRSQRQFWSAGRQLATFVERERPALLHFHTPNAAFFGRLGIRRIAPRVGAKVVYTAHGFHFFHGGSALCNRIFRTAEAAAARFTDALLTINGEDARAASAFRLHAGGFTTRIHGVGLNGARFDPARYDLRALREHLRAELGLPRDVRVLGMVAEFNPGKRHRDLIVALARCREVGVHVALAGTGPLVDAVRTQAAALGVGDRVHLLGYRKDIPEILAAVDGLAMPSEREGLPTCVMEAMCMGRPVIGADARGTRDLLQPDCGWVHATGDSDGLAAAIRELFLKPEEAKARAARARERILREYTWPAVEAELCAVYERLGLPMRMVAAVGKD